MTATKNKLVKNSVTTFDNEENKKYETKPVILDNVRTLKGYKYYNPIGVLIQFEKDKRDKVLKHINKIALNNDGKAPSYTAVINDALDIYLYAKGLIKLDDVSPDALLICNAIFKPTKNKNKKQK